MRRPFCLLILAYLISSVRTQGQQYDASEIKERADAYIIQFIGTGLFRHCHLMEDISYDFIERGQLRYHVLSDNDNIIKVEPRRIYLVYQFVYEFPNDEDTTIINQIGITLDKYLQLTKLPDFGFIPSSVWNAKEHQFISSKQIHDIIIKNGFAEPDSEHPVRISLVHHKGTKEYSFVVTNGTLDEVKTHELRVLVLDARTGDVLKSASGSKALELLDQVYKQSTD